MPVRRSSASRPECSPSLADDDEEFASVVRPASGRSRAPGARRADVRPRRRARELGMRPDFEIAGAPLRSIARIVDGQRVTFVANPAADEVRARSRVPAEVGALSALGSRSQLGRRPLARDRADRPTAASFDVTLPAFGSVFVVPATEPAPGGRIPSLVAAAAAWSLRSARTREGRAVPRPAPVDRPRRRGARLLGHGDLSNTVRLPDRRRRRSRHRLDSATVRDIARVSFNGVDCGMAWTAPFRVDVTAAVRAGLNTLEVQVATPWRNRLIAEAAAPTGRSSRR